MNSAKTENKIGVLVSGGGTNLQSIIDNIHFGDSDATIECVISNKKNVYALTRAEHASIANMVRNGGMFGASERINIFFIADYTLNGGITVAKMNVVYD